MLLRHPIEGFKLMRVTYFYCGPEHLIYRVYEYRDPLGMKIITTSDFKPLGITFAYLTPSQKVGKQVSAQELVDNADWWDLTHPEGSSYYLALLEELV